jgi:hypothetical protein
VTHPLTPEQRAILFGLAGAPAPLALNAALAGHTARDARTQYLLLLTQGLVAERHGGVELTDKGRRALRGHDGGRR